MTEGIGALRCRNCAGAMGALAEFCGQCGVTRAQALGSEPIPPDRVVGPNDPRYAANEAARERGPVPPATPVVESAPEPPRGRRTFSLDEVERESREREEQLQRERLERERLEQERIAQEAEERRARLEREAEERRIRIERDALARKAAQERERRAALKAQDDAVVARENKLRRARPLGMVFTALSVLAVIWVAVQWNLYSADSPQAIVEQYAKAVTSHDVKALAENTELFPHADGAVVLPAKFQEDSLPQAKEWNADIDWNNWTGHGSATITIGTDKLVVELAGVESWTKGIFRTRHWTISSPAPTLELGTAGAGESGRMTLNGVVLGANAADNSSGLVGKPLLVFPGRFSLSTAAFGYAAGQYKSGIATASSRTSLALSPASYSVPSNARDKALKAMLKAARNCASKDCSEMPYFTDDDFNITEPWSYEYVSSRNTAYGISGCTVESVNPANAETAWISGTCSVTAARSVRWITYYDDWSGYYTYWDDSGTAFDSVSLRALVRINPKNGSLSIKSLDWT